MANEYFRVGAVKVDETVSGYIRETESGYEFFYTTDYLQLSHPSPVSVTLPLRKETYASNTLFPFFDGLIPEGWLLLVAEKVWKVNPRDRMGLLLTCCRDCIGNISVEQVVDVP